MCIWRKKYYYQVYNYDNGKIYYIMCENCYKLLPKYLKEKTL